MIFKRKVRDTKSPEAIQDDAYRALKSIFRYRLQNEGATGAYVVSLHIKVTGEAIRLVQVDGITYDSGGQPLPIVLSRARLSKYVITLLIRFREEPDFEDAIMTLTALSPKDDPTIEIWWDEEARARAIDGYNWADRAAELNPLRRDLA